MSEISSTSELTTKEIVEQAISDYHMSILPYLAKGNNGYSDTPIGAIQFFDDDTAPSGWLVADGTIYNISDYPFLASHYERVHGSKNHYGGDGVTTFAVPDWRGEFFRASGPNAHPNQGDGANVGVHQDATEIASNWVDTGANQFVVYKQNDNNTNHKNQDSYASGATGYQRPNASSYTSDVSDDRYFTSRPTCTSGLCCIKAVPAGINYSLEEQEIGTWVDGKSLYRKTIITTVPSINGQSVLDFTNKNLVGISDAHTIWVNNGDSATEQLPYYASSNDYCRIRLKSNAIQVIYEGTWFIGQPLWFNIKYTKTTD